MKNKEDTCIYKHFLDDLVIVCNSNVLGKLKIKEEKLKINGFI